MACGAVRIALLGRGDLSPLTPHEVKSSEFFLLLSVGFVLHSALGRITIMAIIGPALLSVKIAGIGLTERNGIKSE